MLTMLSAPRRWSSLPLHILLFLCCTQAAQALTQLYCSNQNTGSGWGPIYWQFQSLGRCSQQTCGPAGFAFAIVQWTNCWCSNYAPSNVVPVSDCNVHCPGFPAEDCGSLPAGLFGYIGTGQQQPLGTLGGSQPAPAPSSPATPQNTQVKTVYTTTKDTIVKTYVSTQVNTLTPQVKTVTKKETSVKYHLVPVTVTKHKSTFSTSISVHTTVEVVTVNGQRTTVSSGASAAPLQSLSPHISKTHSGFSSGAVAGIVIGALVGFAILGAVVIFFCWRPRRRDSGDKGGAGQSINRNTSVLSKVGLLRSNSQAEPPMTTRSSPKTIVAATAPRIDTAIMPSSGEPSSAISGLTMESRRGSRPLFVDTRLNPHALMEHPNASRTSIGTLQDNQDYSRPLEVRNPDPI